MKIYKWNRRKKTWFERVDWLKVAIIFTLSFLLLFAFFYGLLNPSEHERAVATSLLLSFLLSLGKIISDVIENRIDIYVEKENKLYILSPHRIENGYDQAMISYKSFQEMTKNQKSLESIFKKGDQYIGIDQIEIEEILKYKKHRNCFSYRAKIISKEWKEEGGLFTVSSYKWGEKKKTKRFIIPDDYENDKELCDKIISYQKKKN